MVENTHLRVLNDQVRNKVSIFPFAWCQNKLNIRVSIHQKVIFHTSQPLLVSFVFNISAESLVCRNDFPSAPFICWHISHYPSRPFQRRSRCDDCPFEKSVAFAEIKGNVSPCWCHWDASSVETQSRDCVSQTNQHNSKFMHYQKRGVACCISHLEGATKPLVDTETASNQRCGLFPAT